MQSDHQIIGVDVSKDTLAHAFLGSSSTPSISNTEASIRNWLQRLPAGSILAMESTGAYHQLLAALAHAAGMQVFVINARDVYFYAKALGTRGKTDRVDAQVIARYVAEHRLRLHAWKPASAAQQLLCDLVRRRNAVTTHRVALRQTLGASKSLGGELGCLEAQFDRLLDALDRQIKDCIDSDEEIKQADRRLQTITGIKLVGSALLLSILGRIPFANVDALVAYSGLDPRPNDSGRKRGRRTLSKKGPPELRRQMYLAGFSAARSKAFKAVYQSLLAKGFKPTEAFVILGRKILRIAWAVWNSGKPFDPARTAASMA